MSSGLALGSASGTIELDADRALRSLGQVGDALNGFDRQSRNIGASFGTVGRGLGILGAAVLGGLGGAVKVAADFEAQMSAVQAVTGATGEEFVRLSDLALQLGKDTTFSASESAAAIEELAKAGVSVGDILQGAAQGATDLAAAAGVDVPQAAIVMANALNVFNLAGTEATHVADVFAAAANKSASDVGSLAQGLAQSGQVAASFGLSLEDTVGTLALFADAGLRGSDAGTSFRTMLLSMLDPTAKQSALMDELGISFFDAQGNFIGLAGTADVLQTALSGMTEEQRNTALAVLFGADAVRAANILYDAGAEGVQEYTDAVNDEGAAHDAAATRLDNFRGSLEQLKGSLETAAIIVGGIFLPALRGLVDGAARLVDLFIDLPGPIQAAAAVIAAIAGGALSLAGAFALAGPSILRFVAALKAIAPIILGLSAPILAVVAALGLLALAFKTNFLGIGDGVRAVAEKIGDAFGAVAGAVKGVVAPFAEVGRAIVALFNAPFSGTRFAEASEIITGLGQALGRLGFGHDQIQAVRGALTKLALPLRKLRNTFTTVERASEGFLRIVTGKATRGEIEHFTARISKLFGDETGTAITRAVFRVRDAFRDFGRGLREAFDIPPGTGILTAVITGLIGAVGGLVSFVNDRLIPALGPVLLAVLNGVSAALEFFAAKLDRIVDAARTVAQALGEDVSRALGIVGDLLRGDFRAAFADALGLITTLIQQGANLVGWALRIGAPVVTAWATDLWEWLRTTAIPGFFSLAGEIIDWTLTVGAPKLAGWIADIASDVWGWIAGKLGLGGRLNAATGDLTGGGQPQQISIADWVLSVAAPALAGWLKDIGEDVWGWFEDKVVALWDAASRTITDFTDWVLELGEPLPGAVADIGAWILARLRDIPFIVRGFTDWILELGEPLPGAVADIQAWIAGRLGDFTHTVADFTGWVLEVGVPSVANAIAGLDLGPKIKTLLGGRDATEVEFNNWTLVIHPPLDATDESQSKREIERTINRLPFIRAELRAWDLVLFGPSSVDSTGEERGPVETFLNGQNFEFHLSFWDLVLGIPGVREIGIVAQGVEDALRIIQPLRVFLEQWEIDLPVPNFPTLTPEAITFWIAGELADKVIAPILPDWDLSLDAPDFPDLTVAQVVGWITDAFLALDVPDAVLNPWTLFLDRPDFPDLTVELVVGWVAAALLAVGDISVPLPAWDLTLPTPSFPDLTAATVIGWIAEALLAVGDISIPFPGKISIDFPLIGGKRATDTDFRLFGPEGFDFAGKLRTALGGEGDGGIASVLLKPFQDAAAAIPGIMRTFTAGVEGPLQRLRATMQQIGQSAAQQFQQTLSAGLVLSRQAVQSAADQMGQRLRVFATEAGVAGRSAGNAFRDGLTGGMAAAVGAALDALSRIRSAVAGFSLFGQGLAIGRSLGQGVAAGIQGMIGAIANAAAGAVNAAEAAARNAADARSPSRLFMRLGRDLIDGLRLPFADLGPFMDGIFTQLFRDTGQMARQWVATLPNELAATADQIAGTVGRFIGAVIQDGDWLNDWLTHLPDTLRGPAQDFGRAFASALELGTTLPVPGRAMAAGGGTTVISPTFSFPNARITDQDDARALMAQAWNEGLADLIRMKPVALGRAGAGA